MITAIINKLKTGTYTNVYSRNDGVTNPSIPYVIVWEDSRNENISGYFISLHMLPGNTDLIDNYIDNELKTLLHKVVLTYNTDQKFRLHMTDTVSVIVNNNDDGSISRDRLFSLPKLGAL